MQLLWYESKRQGGLMPLSQSDVFVAETFQTGGARERFEGEDRFDAMLHAFAREWGWGPDAPILRSVQEQVFMNDSHGNVLEPRMRFARAVAAGIFLYHRREAVGEEARAHATEFGFHEAVRVASRCYAGKRPWWAFWRRKYPFVKDGRTMRDIERHFAGRLRSRFPEETGTVDVSKYRFLSR